MKQHNVDRNGNCQQCESHKPAFGAAQVPAARQATAQEIKSAARGKRILRATVCNGSDVALGAKPKPPNRSGPGLSSEGLRPLFFSQPDFFFVSGSRGNGRVVVGRFLAPPSYHSVSSAWPRTPCGR